MKFKRSGHQVLSTTPGPHKPPGMPIGPWAPSGSSRRAGWVKGRHLCPGGVRHWHQMNPNTILGYSPYSGTTPTRASPSLPAQDPSSFLRWVGSRVEAPVPTGLSKRKCPRGWPFSTVFIVTGCCERQDSLRAPAEEAYGVYSGQLFLSGAHAWSGPPPLGYTATGPAQNNFRKACPMGKDDLENN